MTGEQSLLGKVFKGKYYPRGSIENSSPGFAPIYAWRSTLNAKDLTAQGMRWLIGNDGKVRVWLENWLLENAGSNVIRNNIKDMIVATSRKEFVSWSLMPQNF